MSVAQLNTELTSVRRQRAFAWAKYYEQVHSALRDARRHHATYTSTASEEMIPEHIKTQFKEMAAELKKKWECPVCLDMIEETDLEITNCGHYYCKPCLAQLKSTQKAQHKPKWECAVCRRKHGYKPDDE